MKAWNDQYRHQAQVIAASIVGKRGHEWTASEIERGRRNSGVEVEIAMLALMVARGELELPKTSYSVSREFAGSRRRGGRSITE